MSEAEKQSIIEGGNWRYLWLGATHMLSGYDHLAFVFGIVFFLTTFRDIAKYVTAFTVGHSVTLIYATFNAIQMNYFLIDAVIALSVCYIAFANLDGFRKYLSINPPNMMVMIVGLGLIHGFGLSTRLQALPLSEDHLLMNIISFNIGIELGQVSALVIMLLLIAAWRHTHFFQAFSVVTNYALILLGGFLFLMQMHGYEHTANASEFVAESSTATTEAASSPGMVETQQAWRDTKQITIPPRGDLEYKIFVSKGKTFSFAWQTDGEALFYDFHGEPAGDTTGYFESFEKNTQWHSSGEHTATFSGTHGWYWKNNTRSPVVITLNTNGDYQSVDTMKKRPSEPPPVGDKPKTHESIF
ncbi:MAG: HupE/UreJ family protein [Candidatus Thiodiazotropha endolucinida]